MALQLIINCCSPSAEEYYSRGVEKEEIKDYKGEIADYTKAIEIDSNFSAAYNSRGNAKSGIYDYKGAIEDYNKAIEIDADFTFAYYNRGLLKAKLKDYRGAIADFIKDANRNPEIDEDDHIKQGNIEYRQKDFKGAIYHYTEATKVDSNMTIYFDGKHMKYYPKTFIAYYNRGLAKSRLSDYRGAVVDYTIAIETYRRDIANDPIQLIGEEFSKEYGLAYYNRGLTELILGQQDSVCLDLIKALENGESQANSVILSLCK